MNRQAVAGMYYARKRNRTQTAVVDDNYSPAWGSIAFPVNPSNAQTITINGTVITFGSTVTIGADIAATVAATAAYIAAHPISGVTVTGSGNGLSIQSVRPADTSVTLAASNATVSHATLQKQQIRKRVPL